MAVTLSGNRTRLEFWGAMSIRFGTIYHRKHPECSLAVTYSWNGSWRQAEKREKEAEEKVTRRHQVCVRASYSAVASAALTAGAERCGRLIGGLRDPRGMVRSRKPRLCASPLLCLPGWEDGLGVTEGLPVKISSGPMQTLRRRSSPPGPHASRQQPSSHAETRPYCEPVFPP